MVVPELRGPTDKLAAEPSPKQWNLAEQAGGPSVIVFWYGPIRFPDPDQYTINLRLDGKETFSRAFQIPQAPPGRSY